MLGTWSLNQYFNMPRYNIAVVSCIDDGVLLNCLVLLNCTLFPLMIVVYWNSNNDLRHQLTWDCIVLAIFVGHIDVFHGSFLARDITLH